MNQAGDKLDRAADWVERACEGSIHEESADMRHLEHTMTMQAAKMFDLPFIQIRRELLSRQADRCIADLPRKVRKRC